jgi:antitoxin MazE
MQTSLRKMGNSTGMILPKPILKALGVSTGTIVELRVEKGEVIGRPLSLPEHESWAEDAARIGALPLTEEEQDWMDAPSDDSDWEW